MLVCAVSGELVPDFSKYPISAFVGVVDMQESERRGKTVFTPIDNGQLERFKEKDKVMGPVAVNVEHRNLLREQQIQREQGNYYRTFDNIRQR